MDVSNASDDEIVSFPVPKRYLPVVIHALAKVMTPEALQSPSNEPQESSGTDQETARPKIDWKQVSNHKKLRQGLRIPIALALLNLTAEREGEYVPFADIVEKAGSQSSRAARSSLGALTKVIKRDFNVEYDDAKWPVDHRWAEGGDAQYYYRMSSEVAKAWRASEEK